jgi:uncharacterized protein (DUF1697 family)
MTAHVALLRAVNLPNHGKIAMSDLRAIAESLGLDAAQTLLQSGNLVFQTEGKKPAALERLLETRAAKELGVKTSFYVRTAKEWASVIAANPFPEEAARDPGHLVVIFLKDAPDKKAVAALRAAIKGPEIVQAKGPHLYAVYPAGIGRSRLTSAVIEGKLGTSGTGRNWNTILKLAELAKAKPARSAT